MVDDDEEVLDTIRDVLRVNGHEVVTASNYDSALALWSESAFDLVVVDYELNDLTGVDLAEFVWSGSPGIPVLLMTGHTPELLPMEDAIRQRLRFIAKPFKVKEFRAAVAAALG